jgi:hypothetical protein
MISGTATALYHSKVLGGIINVTAPTSMVDATSRQEIHLGEE